MRVAFDVDLHAIHGYSEGEGRLCYKAPEWPWDAIQRHSCVLVEVASAVDTSRGVSAVKHAQQFNRRRWAVHNGVQVGRLMLFAQQYGLTNRVFVSSAEKWTLGHAEATREVVAGCSGEDNHDIRACRCMLFYHSTNPEKWVPIETWYAGL